jgi:hypothetical protein
MDGRQVTGDPFAGWDVIHVYSRAQAIDDGTLVDVSTLATEAGFRYPVALTRTAWDLAVTVPKGCEGFQDETGRLWDVLTVARYMARANGGDTDRVRLTVSTIRNRAGQRRNARLEMVCGPGDDPRPVITIQLPGED